MRIYIFVFFLICICFNLLAQTAIQPVGSGTENDPYQISSLENLCWIAINSKTVVPEFIS